MSEMDILKEFKTQLISFFDELIGQFPEEGDLVTLRLFIATQMPIQDTMNKFNYLITKNNGEFKQMVKDRNEQYFMENDIFKGIDKEKISHFKKIWRSGALDKDDKDVIWNWVDAFIFLADKYSKNIDK